MRVVVALLLLLGLSTGVQAQALKAGDTISISVFQDSKLDRQTLIGPTGMISFPLAGQIKAAGLTPPELENVLKSKLRDKYTSDLDITVSLISQGETTEETKEEEKSRIFITGEVKTPGGLALGKKKMNVMQGHRPRRRIEPIRRQAANTGSSKNQRLGVDFCFRLHSVRSRDQP